MDLILPEEGPTRELFVFTGWNTEANGSGTMYQPSQAYTTDEAITLYAQWMEMDSLVLHSSLTTIKEEAFTGISAAIVRVPGSCTEIGSKTFQNCANLQRIYISATTTTIALDAFDGCGSLTIYAPAGSTAIKVAKYNDIPYVEVE